MRLFYSTLTATPIYLFNFFFYLLYFTLYFFLIFLIHIFFFILISNRIVFDLSKFLLQICCPLRRFACTWWMSTITFQYYYICWLSILCRICWWVCLRNFYFMITFSTLILHSFILFLFIFFYLFLLLFYNFLLLNDYLFQIFYMLIQWVYWIFCCTEFCLLYILSWDLVFGWASKSLKCTWVNI